MTEQNITLAIELDESSFHAIVNAVGVEGWNQWIDALIRNDLTMATWSEGEQVPLVQVFFNFRNDIFTSHPDANLLPVYFPDDLEQSPGLPGSLTSVPTTELPIQCNASLLIDRSS